MPMNNFGYFEDEEENDVDVPDMMGQEENGQQPEASSGSNVASRATEKIASKKKKETAQKIAKKAATKGAAKHSLIAALGPILMWVFIILVIIFITIGIIMFLITMPGMVLEKIKALFKEVGDIVGDFFGTDQTLDVEEVDIYTTLDYLREMEYDLKSWGFLTEPVGSSDSWFETDEDGKISNAKSDFISNYMISENYLYTIKNKNHVSGGGEGGFWNGLKGFGQSLLNVLTLGQTQQFWSRGFIDIWKDGGTIGNHAEYYSDGWLSGDKITISASSKTIEIKRGHGNNAMTYNLDGWVGRYGMPIDFLLSVHIATLMPDLAFDMATTFETQLYLLLHPVGGGEKDANTVIGYYKTPSGDYKSYDEFNAAAGTGLTGWLNSWRISNKEAMSIMKEFGIPSPESCTGVEEEPAPAEGETPDPAATPVTVRCSESTSGEEACGECRAYIQKIYDYLGKADVDSLEIYQPYIEKVENHWYRDIYFVSDSSHKNFVDYDYEYEAMMKERWTLYETDDEGNYVLYELNDDGSYGSVFNGTEEEAEEKGKTVVKKAKTIDITDDAVAEDLNWNKIGSRLSAYEVNAQTSSTFDPMFPEIKPDEEDYEIKKDVYVKINTTGDLSQTGEGQRTETNKEIKKMFLKNQYFAYDDAETAEIIYELRKKRGEDHKYGALTESELNNLSVTLTRNGQTQDYKASDYATTASINQKSLSAFSMLENTHTLDADYIYRDFKELIVELGYFTKEELTDETPRLLQWIIPEIGSAGFPIRALDKIENENGTLIHSEGDYKANEKNTLKALIDMKPETENPEDTENGNENLARRIINGETDIVGQIASIETTPIANLRNVGAIKDIPDSDYKFTPSGSSDTGSKTGDLDIDGISYEVWKQTDSTCTLYSYAFIAQAYTGESPEKYVKTSSGSFINKTGGGQGGNDYWAQGQGVKWDVMFTKDGIAGQYHFPGESDIVEKVAEALGEGKPVYFYGDFKASGDRHAVVFLGAAEGGKLLYYDPGCGAIRTEGSSSSFATNLNTIMTNHFKYRLFIPDEVPTGVKKGGGSSFSGYKGNEAVVSPVTGILLEYGTYDESYIVNQETGEQARVNVDMKYGRDKAPASLEGNGVAGAPDATVTPNTKDPNNQTTPTSQGEEVIDRVGYAKILVLDAENYQLLESKTNNSWRNPSNSLLSTSAGASSSASTNGDLSYNTEKSSVRFKELLTSEDAIEGIEDWSEIDKTIYGYKEFAEMYEKYGIAGNVVYIDGFVCEMPGSSSEEGEEDGEEPDTSSGIPEGGTALTLDSFKVSENEIKSSSDEDGDSGEEEEVPKSMYEKDDEYKLASKKASDKLNAETEIKDAASTGLTVKDNEGKDLIVIKEGTVIGRTMTDKELIENIRENSSKPYEYFRPNGDEENTTTPSTPTTTTGDESSEEENMDKVMGNYIRIIMSDMQEGPIENVEDYMKLDEGAESRAEVDWEFYFWLPYESGGIGELAPGLRTGAASCGGLSADEVAVGFAQWTSLRSGGCNNIPALCKWLAEEDSGLCGSLATFSSWSSGQCCDGISTIQTAWWAVYDQNPQKFMELQMKYFYDIQFKGWLESKGTQWLANKSLVTQGTYASLMNWGPNLGWETVINESMSDEEICKALLTKACGHSSTVGSLNGRWNSEYVLAKDILDGTFTDVENWIKTKQPYDKYGEGKNNGVLAYINLINYEVAFEFINKVLGLI